MAKEKQKIVQHRTPKPAKEIVEEVRTVTRMRCVQRADVMFEDTGEVQIVQVRGADGVLRNEEKQIKKQVFRPSKYVEDSEEVRFFCVSDGDEIHNFRCRKKAENFLKGR